MKRGRSIYWTVSLGFLFSLLAWLGAYLFWSRYGIHLDPQKVAFKDFNDEWGAVIGIFATILVGILAALIPSRVEAQVEDIERRLQQPLENFRAIYAKTLELLMWVRDEPGSEFIMTSATPVFGIELNEVDRTKWQNELRKRILTENQTAPLKTVLLCLSPDSETGLTDSPLWKFCCEIQAAGLLKNAEVHTAGDLFLRSMDAFSTFGRFPRVSDFEISCGPVPPLHFVLARTGRGQSKGILYFSGIKSEAGGLIVSGFSTEDDRWIRLMDSLYDFIRSQHWDVLSAFRHDRRTDEQKARCKELLEYQLSKREKYSVQVCGYSVQVYPDVFPPEIGLGTQHLVSALKTVGGALTAHLGGHPLRGFDVGTGTGLLAIVMAEYCSKVYASDISPVAVRNARENAQTLYKHVPGQEQKIEVFEGNLLDPLSAMDRDAIWIAVFNYPFYPSPLAVYNPEGRDTAGIAIVRKFFDEMTSRAPEDTVLILPCSSLAGHDNHPEIVGREKKFLSVLIEESGGNAVYAFTKSQKIFDIISKLKLHGS